MENILLRYPSLSSMASSPTKHSQRQSLLSANFLANLKQRRTSVYPVPHGRPIRIDIPFHESRTVLWVVPVSIGGKRFSKDVTEPSSRMLPHPLCVRYPDTQSSPGWPAGYKTLVNDCITPIKILTIPETRNKNVPTSTILFLGSTILATTCGCILPTVSVLFSIGSEGMVWNDTGLDKNRFLSHIVVPWVLQAT